MTIQTIAAEYVAAMQRVQILSLRNQGHVTWQEVGAIVQKLPPFLEMPDELTEEIKRIRKERYNIS